MGILKGIAKVILKLHGWKVEGQLPPRPHRFVLILAPHTSDWDVVYAIGAAAKVKLEIKILITKRVFNHIRGPLLRALGGIPIDKDKNEGVVNKAIELFNANKEFVLALNPEGGRAKCTKFKSGFYRIATLANVPILVSYVDYKRKVIGIGELFYPTGNMEEDFLKIWNFYKDKQGKFPELGIHGEPEAYSK